MFRKSLFWLHLVAGVVAGVVILVMSVTGFLLMYERQIVAFAERDTFTSAAPGTVRLTPEELLAKQKEGAPLPASITLRAEEGAPVSFSYGREKTVFINPYTGADLGEGTQLRVFFHEVTDWHRWLANRDIGKPLTGVSNAAFLFLAISGIYLWWPRKWKWSSIKSTVFFKQTHTSKARNFNWHNVVGIWSAPVLIILTATGMVFSYQWANNLVYTLTGTEAPAPRGGGGGPGGPGGGGGGRRQGPPESTIPAIGLSPFFATIKEKAPNWESITLTLPSKQAKAVSVSFATAIDPHPYARNSATLKANDASVDKWEDYASQNAGRKARSWVRGLHTGEAFGLLGQTIAGLASAGGALLVWTGLALSWNRFFGKKRKPSLEKGNLQEAPSRTLP